MAIFDGQTRYNLRLAFERFSTAHPTEGYQGQVVVCSAKFLPVAGYDPKHFLVTYLAAQHETEIWLAPLGSTRLLSHTGVHTNRACFASRRCRVRNTASLADRVNPNDSRPSMASLACKRSPYRTP